jgi:hypothetical protein
MPVRTGVQRIALFLYRVARHGGTREKQVVFFAEYAIFLLDPGARLRAAVPCCNQPVKKMQLSAIAVDNSADKAAWNT